MLSCHILVLLLSGRCLLGLNPEAAELLVHRSLRCVEIVDEQVQELVIGLLVDFPQKELNEGVSVNLIFLKLLHFTGKTDDAVLESVAIPSRVLTLALIADDFGETSLVFVVLDLVARHGHLVAAVAGDGLVRAAQSMLVHQSDV